MIRLVPEIQLATGLTRKTTPVATSCGDAHPAGRVQGHRRLVESGEPLLDVLPRCRPRNRYCPATRH